MNNKLIYEKFSSENTAIRLNKYLSDCGVCSRRAADEIIKSGRITINGRIAVLGDKVSLKDKVFLDGKKLSFKSKLKLIALNKPVGIECTTDLNNPDNIISFLNYPEKLFYIGRLDKNSHGLLLLTNDGDLSNKIAKSVNNHEKEYVVRVNKKITEEFITGMSNGVEILGQMTKKCHVRKIDDFTFNIILTQGLNRQIRRMCESFSYRVLDLKRIRVLNIKLGKLEDGKYREVTKNEIDELLKITC